MARKKGSKDYPLEMRREFFYLKINQPAYKTERAKPNRYPARVLMIETSTT